MIRPIEISKLAEKQLMGQAEGYIEDILHCGLTNGPPFVQAFVVGRELNERTTAVKTVGDPPQGRVQAVTFSQLIRTANMRLFRIRDQVQERYSGSGQDLLDRIMAQPHQADLLGISKVPSKAVRAASDATETETTAAAHPQSPPAPTEVMPSAPEA